MDLVQYSRLILGLVGVLALLGVCAFLVKRFQLFGYTPTLKGRTDALQIISSLPLDPKRNLLLVGVDKRQYLLLLSPTGEQLLEVPPKEDEKAEPAPLPGPRIDRGRL
ncbi:MAG: flagellar biosynthetic protein FliO [Alphaproteobacteria bacterium]|nr:flagellar biosynthetic protein FliO [Alphaproteobacteria bacterium]